jgi:hypothetical protein
LKLLGDGVPRLQCDQEGVAMTVDDDLAVLLEMLERHDYYSRALLLSAALLHVLIEKNGRDIPACLDDFNAFAKRMRYEIRNIEP